MTPTRRDFAGRNADEGGVPTPITLCHRRPYDWPAIRDFLAARAIPGIETVTEDAYARTILVAGRPGSIAVSPGRDGLVAIAEGVAQAEHPAVAARLRRLFDSDADPSAIGAHLSRDPHLAPLVAARPGLRVPGAWCGFELGIRAILGQQVSVTAATRLAGRLVAELGLPLGSAAGPGLTHLFPTPEAVAAADIAKLLDMPRARGAAIRAFAESSLAEPDLFTPGQDLAVAARRLTAIRGIGPWTAQYIAMRALRAADALPVGDIGLMRALDVGAGRPRPRRAPSAGGGVATLSRLCGDASLDGGCRAFDASSRAPSGRRMPPRDSRARDGMQAMPRHAIPRHAQGADPAPTTREVAMPTLGTVSPADAVGCRSPCRGGRPRRRVRRPVLLLRAQHRRVLPAELPVARGASRNVAFHATCEAAEAAGFRPCKRCRPDEASRETRRAEAVARACRLIEEAEAAPALDALARAPG